MKQTINQCPTCGEIYEGDKTCPCPKGDTTQARRQSKRRKELEAAAIRDGFNTASEAITAWKNGEAVLVKKPS